LASNLGLIGMGLFLAFMVVFVQRALRAAKWLVQIRERIRSALVFLSVLWLCQFVSIPDLSFPPTWVALLVIASMMPPRFFSSHPRKLEKKSWCSTSDHSLAG
jgi:hypothetical protein